MSDEDMIRIYYNMLREFDYEKNGLVSTIGFLEFMLEQLKKTRN